MQQQNRGGFRRRKVCYFTQNHIEHIDFKDVDLLRKFVKEKKKIFLFLQLKIVKILRLKAYAVFARRFILH